MVRPRPRRPRRALEDFCLSLREEGRREEARNEDRMMSEGYDVR